MNFFTENWFKIILLIIVLFSLISYFFLEGKKHNLDVVNSIRLCANANLSDETVRDCSEAIKRNYIFIYLLLVQIPSKITSY